MQVSRKLGFLVGSVAISATLCLQTATANAQTANVTVTGTSGTLGFVTPPATFAFGGVTSGAIAVNSTASEAMDVNDATGSGAGWNIQITGANLVSGSNNIPASNVTVTGAPTYACDAANSCTVPTNSGGVSYAPWVLSTSAQKFISVSANKGMGTSSTTNTFTMVVPGGTPGGTYSATWTVSLISGP